MLNIISVDLNTGDVIIFDETTPIELQANSMIASASIPGVFPPEKSILEHSALADGGLFT
jgi:predicted acylesterase/phospholipase RssA